MGKICVYIKACVDIVRWTDAWFNFLNLLKSSEISSSDVSLYATYPNHIGSGQIYGYKEVEINRALLLIVSQDESPVFKINSKYFYNKYLLYVRND